MPQSDRHLALVQIREVRRRTGCSLAEAEAAIAKSGAGVHDVETVVEWMRRTMRMGGRQP